MTNALTPIARFFARSSPPQAELFELEELGEARRTSSGTATSMPQHSSLARLREAMEAATYQGTSTLGRHASAGLRLGAAAGLAVFRFSTLTWKGLSAALSSSPDPTIPDLGFREGLSYMLKPQTLSTNAQLQQGEARFRNTDVVFDDGALVHLHVPEAHGLTYDEVQLAEALALVPPEVRNALHDLTAEESKHGDQRIDVHDGGGIIVDAGKANRGLLAGLATVAGAGALVLKLGEKDPARWEEYKRAADSDPPIPSVTGKVPYEIDFVEAIGRFLEAQRSRESAATFAANMPARAALLQRWLPSER